MARRTRDYKAEERRRNELAKARGFRNRAEQRRAIETGLVRAIRPAQVKRKDVRKAQKRLSTTRRDAAEEWSAVYSKRSVSRFDLEDAKDLGLTKAEYTDRYFEAWVGGESRYAEVRHSGGSRALHYWLVNVMGMSDIEYEQRYGKL